MQPSASGLAGAEPQAARPRDSTAKLAAPTTKVYVGWGTRLAQRQVARLWSGSASAWPSASVAAGSGWAASAPLAITCQADGAWTVKAAVALSDGWSTDGSQKRARLGQLSTKAAGAPCTLSRRISPSSGTPW